MNEDIIEKIRDFIVRESRSEKIFTNYKVKSDPVKYFNTTGINVDLEQYKDIILQEDTYLELGGMNRHSFSLIHPINQSKLIEDGNIKLLGPEIHQISESEIDFGLFILIEVNDISENQYFNLKTLNFISNAIEGFSIRTIPRRFWCRIDNNVINKNFSFEFLANAIIYLYKKKFKSLIKKIEILMISSYQDSIDEFIKISSAITNRYKKELKAKIDEWRKRIDCDYDWGCGICPYQEECYDIKQVLVEREKIGR